MKFRRDAGEISVKAFRDIDRSPRRRDILKRTEELPVTSVGRPALLLRFVDRYCLNFVRQRKVLQEFRLGNSRFELQWQTGSEVRRRRNSGSRESFRFRRRNNAAWLRHGKSSGTLRYRVHNGKPLCGSSPRRIPSSGGRDARTTCTLYARHSCIVSRLRCMRFACANRICTRAAQSTRTHSRSTSIQTKSRVTHPS